jgi:hypothetical protein
LKIHHKIGLVAGPLVAAGGMAAIVLASGGSAMASTPQPGVVYGNPVTLSVTLPNSTTLTISSSTESISFGSPTVLPAILGPVNSVTGGTSYTGEGAPTSTTVNGTVVSNDPNGYTVQATANDSPWGAVETPSISGIASALGSSGSQYASEYASEATANPTEANSDTGATGLPAVTCNESLAGYSAAAKRIPENWLPIPVASGGSLYASSTAHPSSGNIGTVPTTSATGIEPVFVNGVDTINDSDGMAQPATCATTSSTDFTSDGFSSTPTNDVTDTFSTAGYLPWSDLSVVGNNGTFSLASAVGGSSTVTTDACSPVSGATAGQPGYCGPDGSGSDPVSDAWTLDVPGNQAPGTFYGNLGYAVLSN